MTRFACFLFVLCLAAPMAPCSADDLGKMASERWHAWRKAQTRYPIATWAYFSRYPGEKSEYQLYEVANMTFVTVPATQYENAASTGLGILLGGWEGLHVNKELLAKRIEQSNASMGRVIGYQLMDEPEPKSFEDLGRAVRTIYEQDKTTAIPIIDLLPNWAWQRSSRRQIACALTYDDFVDAYIQAVRPPMLLCCHYAPLPDGTDRPDYYANLETLRDHALRHDIGLMAFVLATEYKGTYRHPSESDLRWQVYTALAYGAQGIWYWNWRIKPDENGPLAEGLVLHETGEPRENYHLIKAINKEVLAIGGTLMKLRSRNVFHTSDSVPPGGRRLPDLGLSGASAVEKLAGGDFLLGEFRNADDEEDKDAYVMVVNKRHAKDKASSDPSLQAQAWLKPCPPYKHVYAYEASSGTLTALKPTSYSREPGYYSLTLGGGQGVLLRLARTPRD